MCSAIQLTCCAGVDAEQLWVSEQLWGTEQSWGVVQMWVTV